jgi:NOL1/NOP2/fmu family ribosome biogenesis protein
VEALPLLPGFMPGRPEWSEVSTEVRELTGAVRLFPHRLTGEGHFACMLRRMEDKMPAGEWKYRGPGRASTLTEMNRLQAGLWTAFASEVLAAGFAADRLKIRGERLYFIPEEMPDFGNLRVVHPGVWFGNFKKERFEPAHPLALFLRRGQAKNSLDLAAGSPALAAYLRGETLPSSGPAGWTLVTVDGWPLGWGKRVQGVVKNHYPRGWMSNINP